MIIYLLDLFVQACNILNFYYLVVNYIFYIVQGDTLICLYIIYIDYIVRVIVFMRVHK